MSTCKHPGCKRPCTNHGTYCAAHYDRLRKGQDMDASLRDRTNRADREQWETLARKMREAGAYLREIAEVTGCGKDALRVWLKDVPAGKRPPRVVHGTTSAWQWYGCRCEICTESKRVYKAEEHARRMERANITNPHGTAAAYRQGCKCQACRIAVATLGRDRNHATRGDATHHGEEWTREDALVAFDTSLSIKERAAILGRTYAAVDNFIRAYKRRGLDPLQVLHDAQHNPE